MSSLLGISFFSQVSMCVFDHDIGKLETKGRVGSGCVVLQKVNQQSVDLSKSFRSIVVVGQGLLMIPDMYVCCYIMNYSFHVIWSFK